MKTRKIFLSIILVSVFITTGCMNQAAKNESSNSQTTTEKVVYTCPMHPEVQSDKPGSCPKCGMDLVKREVSADTIHNMIGDSMAPMKHK
jgi:PBP1b-binding outer membrane lipoprotein LpoB